MTIMDEILLKFGPAASGDNITSVVIAHVESLEDRVASVEKFKEEFESLFGPVEEFWEKWTKVEAEL
jgi:hypothetical protein